MIVKLLIINILYHYYTLFFLFTYPLKVSCNMQYCNIALSTGYVPLSPWLRSAAFLLTLRSLLGYAPQPPWLRSAASLLTFRSLLSIARWLGSVIKPSTQKVLDLWSLATIGTQEPSLCDTTSFRSLQTCESCRGSAGAGLATCNRASCRWLRAARPRAR